MQFRTNLATRTYIDKKKLNSVLLAGIAVLLLLLVVQIKISAFNAGEISRLNAMKISMESRLRKKRIEFSENDYKKLTGDIKFANGILEKKAFDWVELLNKLEGVVPDGLTLTSVEPNTAEKSLKLSGVSLSFKTIQHLLDNLEGSHFFHDIYLVKQDESKTIDNKKTLSFAISCKFAL
jgi:type IV pilus assembly protein PilN